MLLVTTWKSQMHYKTLTVKSIRKVEKQSTVDELKFQRGRIIQKQTADLVFWEHLLIQGMG